MARRWTAVDRETGELLEFPSRAAMRQAIRDNPVLRSREREDIFEHRASKGLPRVGPLWSATQWTADTVSMKRERAFDNATAGLRYAFLAAVTSKDAVAAARIRQGWEANVKAYAEGNLNAKEYQQGMSELVAWLNNSPYAPPINIPYREGADDYDPPDYMDEPEFDVDNEEFEV